MKKIINVPENVVEEMLQGVVLAHPEYVKRVDGFNVIVRADKGDKVALVSGGGSGHGEFPYKLKDRSLDCDR